MDISDRRGLLLRAKERLANARFDPKKLILIHAGATALVLLVIALADWYLQMQIADTGGLEGMGLRSILSTVSQTLSLVVNLALPFWNMGYIAAVLAISREQDAFPATLLEGFRRFPAVMRLTLVRELGVMALGMLCFYPAAFLFMMTPLSRPLIQTVTPLMSTTQDPYAIMEDPAVVSAIQEAAVPMAVIFLILFSFVMLPLVFRLRFADMALLDDPAAGAIAALRKSWSCTRGRCGGLLKLDMGFWWYYLGELAITALAFGDVLLPYLGIELPADPQLTFLGIYVFHLAAQFALCYFAKNRVSVAYALAYDAIRDTPAPVKAANVPWTY